MYIAIDIAIMKNNPSATPPKGSFISITNNETITNTAKVGILKYAANANIESRATKKNMVASPENMFIKKHSKFNGFMNPVQDVILSIVSPCPLEQDKSKTN